MDAPGAPSGKLTNNFIHDLPLLNLQGRSRCSHHFYSTSTSFPFLWNRVLAGLQHTFFRGFVATRAATSVGGLLMPLVHPFIQTRHAINPSTPLLRPLTEKRTQGRGLTHDNNANGAPELDLRRSDRRKPRKTPQISALTRLAAYPKTIYRTRLSAIVICSTRHRLVVGWVKRS